MSPHETTSRRSIAWFWMALLVALAGCGDNIGTVLGLDTAEIDVVIFPWLESLRLRDHVAERSLLATPEARLLLPKRVRRLH
jgi:hypothetical protein